MLNAIKALQRRRLLTAPLRAIPALLLSLAMFAAQIAPIAVPTVLLGGVVVTQTACDTKDVSKIAGEIADGLDDVIPIFRSNGQSVVRLEQARDIARKVKISFDGGDIEGAVAWTEKLIGLFDLIVGDANAIKDPTTRTVVLVGLVFVRRAIRNLADKMAEKAPDVVAMGPTSQSAQTIQTFRARKNWRCRSSITGRFEKMEVCKQHPDQTQVETY